MSGNQRQLAGSRDASKLIEMSTDVHPTRSCVFLGVGAR